MATSVVDMKTADEKQGRRVEIVRVIKASRQRVFDALTRPEIIQQWFGPETMTVPDAGADARVDGKYHITMQGSPAPGAEERTARVEGRYTLVDPYDAIAFTWIATWAPGEESLVTITLRDVEGGTEMKLVHEGFASDGSRDGHSKGWSGGLDKLQRLLEKN